MLACCRGRDVATHGALLLRHELQRRRCAIQKADAQSSPLLVRATFSRNVYQLAKSPLRTYFARRLIRRCGEVDALAPSAPSRRDTVDTSARYKSRAH